MRRAVRGAVLAAVVAGAALTLTACGGTTGYSDASHDAQVYAQSYCQTEAAFDGRPDSGGRYDSCLDEAAVRRDAS